MTDEMRKFDAIDELLAALDGIAREHDSYDYGLPMAMHSDEYKAMRERVAAYEVGYSSREQKPTGNCKSENCLSSRLMYLPTRHDPEELRSDVMCLDCLTIMASHKWGYRIIQPARVQPDARDAEIERLKAELLSALEGLQAECGPDDARSARMAELRA